MHHWVVTSVYFPRKSSNGNKVCRFQVADVSCQAALKKGKKIILHFHLCEACFSDRFIAAAWICTDLYNYLQGAEV